MKAQPTEREIHKDELYAQHLENQEQAMKELVDEKRAEQLQRFQTHQELIAQPSVPRYNPLYTLGKHAGKPGFTRDQMNMASEKGLRLVPIRLDVDHEGVKIRDTFTWNLYETVISPELFARRLCKDVGFYQPTKELLNQIIGSLTEQIADYNQYAPEQLDQRETLNRGNDGIDSGEHDHAELRTIIKLDITIDQQCVVDQFEWDIGCSRNSPEIFAELLVSELKLVPEFKTAIAHSIREQIQSVSKSLLIGNHDFTSSKIRDEELSSLFLQPVLPGLSRRYGESWDKFGTTKC